MAAEWNVLVPAQHYCIFTYITNSGSKKYNFIQLYVGDELETFFPAQSSSPWMHRILKQKGPVDYRMLALAQDTPSTNTSPLDISAKVVVEDREWVVTLKGKEGKAIQFGVKISVT